MEHTAMGSKYSEHCFACLSTEESRIYCYKLCNSVLKAIFQTDTLFLCYLCRRRSKQAELFIHNVQSNQILLQNLHDLTETKLQLARTQLHPICQLVCSSPQILELEPKDSELEKKMSTNEEQKPECNNKINNITVVIKQEMKEEGLVDHNDTDREITDEECPKKVVRKYKKKKDKPVASIKIKKEKKDGAAKCNVKTVHITREQCMQERAHWSLERKYVLSTYKCEDCVKGFTFKDGYDKHMEKHSPDNGDFECDICKQRMSTEEKLINHKKYHEIRYCCPVCGYTCATRLTVKDHYIQAHTDLDYKHCCPYCSKIFKRRLLWRRHISAVHNQKRVTCKICNKTYANNNALRIHQQARHPEEGSSGIAKPHACPECGKAFRAASLLRAHATKHSHNRDYYCVECDKSFKSATSLKHHLKAASVHATPTELPLSCDHCDMRFAVRRSLERHVNSIHLNIKPFQCDQCERAYASSWSLTDHKRLIHEGYKKPFRYACPMCDKVFQHKKVLQDHVRTHTGERPFQCSICPAQFAQASVLKTHINLIHLKLTRAGKPKGVGA